MSELKEFWKILKDSDFKNMDIHKAFARRCTPNACIELLAEIDELQNTRTQSQWISVADDFPKAYEEVYIWPRPDYGYECFTGIYDKNYQCWIAKSHNDHGSERHKVNVTHWANLPLTPKEQGQ